MNKKKKIVALALFCLFVATSLQAQVGLFSYGVKAGVSLSNTRTKDFDMGVGLDAGIFADYNITRRVFLRSGLEFTMKGAKLDYRWENTSEGDRLFHHDKYHYHLNYLQLPVMIGYRHPIAPDTYVYVSGGGYFALGIWSRMKAQETFVVVDNGNAQPTSDDYEEKGFKDLHFKPVDFGLLANIGVEHGPYSLTVGYEYGLLNIHKTGNAHPTETRSASYYSPNYSWHNMNGTCTLGYKF